MSVYRNDRAREVMADWYQRFIDELSAPVQFEQVETTFGRTNVLLTGPTDAPKLLCFHGAMGSAASALSLIESLVPHFRIVFPDTVGQPGRSAETYLPLRGDSYGRWAVDVLDGLGIESVRCLGVSMGGYIALKLAQLAPERIEALSLWVPGGLVNGSARDGLRLAWATLALYLWPGDARFRRLYDELFTDFDATFFDFYGDTLSSLKMDRRMPELASTDAFLDLAAPVQVFANELDVIFPADKLLARAKAVFPNLTSAEMLPGMRHVPPFGDGGADAVLEQVRAFLVDPAARPAGVA